MVSLNQGEPKRSNLGIRNKSFGTGTVTKPSTKVKELESLYFGN